MDKIFEQACQQDVIQMANNMKKVFNLINHQENAN